VPCCSRGYAHPEILVSWGRCPAQRSAPEPRALLPPSLSESDLTAMADGVYR
jgi:hypothetical protein